MEKDIVFVNPFKEGERVYHSILQVCPDLRSWCYLILADLAQTPFLLETHGHDVVTEADEPGVVEKPKCLEEEMTSPEWVRRQV